MTIRVLTNKKVQRRNVPVITISCKLKRLTLNKFAVELMTNEFGKDPQFGQILLDDDQTAVFWVRPAEADAEGTNTFDTPSPRTKSLHIGTLLRELKWSLTETARFGATWDSDVCGLRIDVSKRLDKL